MKRAYDSVAKEARRQAILDAAERLFADAEQLPSASQIAEAAGLAKGTVYLYFRTKEEIFAFLLLDGWHRVMESASRPLTSEVLGPQEIRAFISGFAAEVAGHDSLMRLDALGKGVLEENMSEEAMSDFKSQFHRHLDDFGAMLDAKLKLAPGRGTQLIMRTHALTRGLWQSLGRPRRLGGNRKSSDLRFATELEEALTEYWRGALNLDF